jgi:hypothetical protein
MRLFGLAMTLVLCSAGILFSSAPTTEAPPPDRDHVRRLVARLADARFKVRSQADADLRRLGTTAVPLLRKELAAASNLEVRSRLEKIVAALADVGWRTDLAATLARAAQADKPVLVFSTIGEVDGFC